MPRSRAVAFDIVTKPLAIDLCCGLGGWAEGLLAEGYDVISFDIERHIYGEHRYPAQLVIQDVLTLCGSQFKDARLIVASPPCQKFSWMAMPWSRAKAVATAIRGDESGEMLGDLTRLFDACFRIQGEASLAAGRHIPMVVENVKGAQSWVGRARWHFGSYYLWGDVPALMPFAQQAVKQGGSGQAWWDKVLDERRKAAPGVKIGGGADGWFGRNSSPMRVHSSGSSKRKAASAMIAKIPLTLSRHIAATYAH